MDQQSGNFAGDTRTRWRYAGSSKRPALVLAISLATLVGVPSSWALSQLDGTVGDSPYAVTAESTHVPDSATTISPVAPPVTPPAQPPPAPPVRISVPALGIDVAVVAVGVRQDGQMEIPPENTLAGWYRFGPAPGSPEGSAVIAAHVDTPTGTGAFFPLRDTTPGTAVALTLEDGTVLTYTVTARDQWGKADLPVERVFESVGPPRLTLVTCGGRFDRTTGRYTDNVVVTATPVGRG